MNECIICYEKYNKTRKEVKCMYCDHVACSTCYESYLLTQYNGEHCMNNNCKINNSVRLWTRNFINDNFTKKFIKSALKKHQEEVILQKAKSRLPEAQQTVERMNQREKLDKEIQEINKQIAFLDLKKKQLNDQYNNTTTSNKKIQAKQFIRKCGNEQCRGFLDTKWNCGICTKNTCKECHIYKDDEENHVCKKEDVETAKMLNTECKACPTCATMIFKIDGCDQMWCTQCKTAFSWNTGIIENKIIHNPHYYEWLFQNRLEDHGQNRIVLNCQEFPTVQELNYFLYQHYPTDNHYPWWKLHRNIIHLREVVLPKFRQDRDRQMDYKSLRLQYLVGDVDEERWCELLQIRQEKQMKLSALFELTQLVADLFTDLISRLISLQQPIPGREEIINVWNFAQDSGERICQIYGGKMPTVWPKDFEF